MQIQKNFYPLLLAVLLALLQVVLAVFFRFGSSIPNLFLVAIVWAVLKRREAEAIYFAVCGGLLFSLFSGALFGSQLLGLCIVLMILYFFSDEYISRDFSPLLAVTLLLSSKILYTLISFSLLFLSDFARKENFFSIAMLRFTWGYFFATSIELIFFPALNYFATRIINSRHVAKSL